jgi:hypothetical protein
MADSGQRDDLNSSVGKLDCLRGYRWACVDRFRRVTPELSKVGEGSGAPPKVLLGQWEAEEQRDDRRCHYHHADHIEEFGIVLHGAILSSRILSCGSFDRRTTNPPTLRHTGGIVQATSGRPPGRCQLVPDPKMLGVAYACQIFVVTRRGRASLLNGL